jgi:hypothetical protein
MRRALLASAFVVALAAAATPAQADIYLQVISLSTADGTQSSEDVGCFSDEDVAISAGYRTYGLPSDYTYLNALGPVEGLPPTVWEVFADNYPGGSPSVAADLFAYCDAGARPGDYKLREKSKQVPDNTEKGADAMCKPSETVVGGGAFTSADFSGEMEINSTGPIDGGDPDQRPDDGWRGVGNNDEDPGAETQGLTTSAVCDRKHDSSHIHYTTRETTIADASVEGRLVRCRPGRRLIGGGITARSSYAEGVYVTTTAPMEPRAWGGFAENYDTPDDDKAKIEITAICLG